MAERSSEVTFTLESVIAHGSIKQERYIPICARLREIAIARRRCSKFQRNWIGGPISDAVQLGVDNIEDPALIPRSVRFEVRKLFLLEAPVFGREFDSGSWTIDVPFLLGRTLKYRCETRKEYVSLWMATYLQAFRGFYFQRFPEHAAQIDANLSEATDEFGASIFGDDASKSIASTFDTLPARMLAQFLDE